MLLREMRWTERDLATASPEIVARLRWLIDAERMAKVAGSLETIVARKPEGKGPDLAAQQFARADARSTLTEIDDYLLTNLSDSEIEDD